MSFVLIASPATPVIGGLAGAAVWRAPATSDAVATSDTPTTNSPVRLSVMTPRSDWYFGERADGSTGHSAMAWAARGPDERRGQARDVQHECCHKGGCGDG